MPDLGTATLFLKVKADQLKAGLSKAQADVGRSTGKMGKAFGNLGAGIKGAAGKVPDTGGRPQWPADTCWAGNSGHRCRGRDRGQGYLQDPRPRAQPRRAPGDHWRNR